MTADDAVLGGVKLNAVQTGEPRHPAGQRLHAVGQRRRGRGGRGAPPGRPADPRRPRQGQRPPQRPDAWPSPAPTNSPSRTATWRSPASPSRPAEAASASSGRAGAKLAPDGRRRRGSALGRRHRIAGPRPAGRARRPRRIGGTAAAPTGPYRLTVSKAANAASRAAGVPPIDVKAEGRLEGDRATVAATLSAGRGAALQVGGSVPALGPGRRSPSPSAARWTHRSPTARWRRAASASPAA